MGCDSPYSNFNTLCYNPANGRWWSTSGLLYSVTAPTKQMVIDKVGKPCRAVMLLKRIEDGSGWLANLYAGQYVAAEVEGTDLPPGIYDLERVNLIRSGVDGTTVVDTVDAGAVPAGIYREVAEPVAVVSR